MPHVPAPPKAEPNPDLKRYKEAKVKWKDSTPAYRHKNPRPETWIPRKIVDTNYHLPTAIEKENKRLAYQDALESIKDRIPPEYYNYYREKYAKPVNFDNEGPDRTGYVNGYKPGMFTHPRFMEKDHSKYHALPGGKMFPEEEKLYKLQETQHVKNGLDFLEDDGMDYEERMWVVKQKAEERRREDERYMREEVFRTTHWIDWDSDDDEISEVGNQSSDVKVPISFEMKQASTDQASPRINNDQSQSDVKEAKEVEKIGAIASDTVTSDTNNGVGPAVVTIATGVAAGLTLAGAMYGIWRFGKGHTRQSRDRHKSGNEGSASVKKRSLRNRMSTPRLWRTID